MSTSAKRWSITADKFLTADQVESLVHHLLTQRDLSIARGNNPQAIRDYYAIRTLLESGLRVAEFCDLAVADFNGLKIVVRHGKGDKPRTVLLTRATAHMLKEWLNVSVKLGHALAPSAPLFPSRYGTAYTTRGMQKRVKAAFSALGFASQLSVHSLRHTYCSLLLASGRVGIGTVRDNLGHHSIAVTNLYSHAMGNLDDVDLYPASSSHKSELSELRSCRSPKNANNSVTAFLRNVNLKSSAPATS
jgi:integrase/recombinase XerD